MYKNIDLLDDKSELISCTDQSRENEKLDQTTVFSAALASAKYY